MRGAAICSRPVIALTSSGPPDASTRSSGATSSGGYVTPLGRPQHLWPSFIRPCAMEGSDSQNSKSWPLRRTWEAGRESAPRWPKPW
eukprot:3566988-Alexandrium_andersonii.AAC.1